MLQSAVQVGALTLCESQLKLQYGVPVDRTLALLVRDSVRSVFAFAYLE